VLSPFAESNPEAHDRSGSLKSLCTRGKDMLADMAIEEIRKDIEHYCDLGSHVIDQARRRVLNGEQVPNAEKIYSIFEPHTDLIKRGKVRTPIEFGHKVGPTILDVPAQSLRAHARG
jgi:transposase, IS5 family